MKKFLLIILIILLLSSCANSATNSAIDSESVSAPENSTTTNSLVGWSENTKSEWGEDENIPEWFPSQKPTYSINGVFSVEKSPIPEVKEPADIIEVTGEYADIFPIVTNDTPLEELIIEVEEPYLHIGYADSFITGFAPQTGCPHISDTQEEKVVADDLLAGSVSLGFFRKTDHATYYTVNKLKGGGYIYYLYAPKVTREDRGKPLYRVDDDETNVYLWGSIYAEKSLSYDDFSSIQIGKTLADVIKIDPAAKMTLSKFNYIYDVVGFSELGQFNRQLVLLTDGILEIEYQDTGNTKNRSANDYKIININYFPDFNYTSSFIPEYWDCEYGEVVVPINILPQDYPPAK